MTATAATPASEGGHASHSQFALLRQRRFAPFFWVQFLGAANDNVFKFAFAVLVTYQLSVAWLPPSLAGLVIGAVFIAPFLLFSATAGQLADKFDKALLTRLVKNLEVVVMALAAFGLLAGWPALLLGCIFLLGLHSTLFGPVKYSYLPSHLGDEELTGGNGLIEMGTFVAILLGNLAGGLLIGLKADAVVPGVQAVAIACGLLAVVGRIAAQFVPPTPAVEPQLRIDWNPLRVTWLNLKLAYGNVVVFRSLLGISWLWFFGAVFLSQFPAFAKDVLHGNERVASLLLMIFSLGVAAGSLMCETLSRRLVEIGLVPLGAIGMSVFAFDLYLAASALPPLPAGAPAFGAAAFVAVQAHWRVLADLFLLSFSAGLFSVPMYALIQLRAPASHRARIVAANNILNALFMIASALIVGPLLGAGLTVAEVFGLTAVANAVVAVYIFLLVPEYLLRFVAWVVTHTAYRLRLRGSEHIPAEGAALIAANHVSYIDAVLLMAVSPRPIRFVMDHRIFKLPLLGMLFRLAKAIPIAPQHEDAAMYESAFEAVDRELADGNLVAIFPEGSITRDGTLQSFRPGFLKILARRPVPVVPVALINLWGSFFSRVENGKAMVRPFRRGMFSRVVVAVGAPSAPAGLTPELLREQVQALMAQVSAARA